MEKEIRNAIERATQRARTLLEDDFASQLEATFDILRNGHVAPKEGSHLSPWQVVLRQKIVAAIEHKRMVGMTAVDAVADYLRESAFTNLNRFIALKMLEERDLVQECITKGEQSVGYREFCGMAPGVALLPESAGYRLYVESLFDELSIEVKVLFDRRDSASILWPRRATFDNLLSLLNATELSVVWDDDETIGWVYQFFNSGEERKKMREESQAPRTSRELAVRNQFFTPRYVVEFLVDNTLGRIWLEMHGDSSDLKERCRYLVRSTEGQALTRPRKDPRDLRILDPACGSGHFLLYCFDLLLVIYEEAWAANTSWPSSQTTGRSLRDDYQDIESLRRASAALILEHNLHGVDIDPRAAQIAALALWLRAQRAWKDFHVPAAERPHIQRTHIVVAEPMPGDVALVDEFATQLDPPLLRDLFGKMVAEMRFAGDLGTLVPVEKALETEVRQAREQFVKQRQTPGFLPGMEPVSKQGKLDFSGIDDDSFFHEAETRIVDALRLFAEAATGGSSMRRKLFANDSVQGVALIDLLRKHFDVVLMNPPFGAACLVAKKEFEKAYPRTKNDIYAAFVERGVQLLQPHGLLGAITSRTGFFLSRFQKWREEVLLKEAPPVVFADLGHGVMDSAMVEAAAYCLEKGKEGGVMKTIFLRALESDDKATDLLDAIQNTTQSSEDHFEVDPNSFRAIPRSPFAYWAGQTVLDCFRRLPSLESEVHHAAAGAQTRDNLRFVRTSWEVSPSTITAPDRTVNLPRAWVPLAKGGSHNLFYTDVHLLVQWAHDGRELKAATGAWRASKGWGDNWRAAINSIEYYGRPGITWPVRSQKGFSARALGAGGIFGHKGPTVFVAGDSSSVMAATLGIMNSKPFGFLVSLQMAFGAYEVGVIQNTPLPFLSATDEQFLASLATQAWLLQKRLDASTETSNSFLFPALLHVKGSSLDVRVGELRKIIESTNRELAEIQDALDKRCFLLYGIEDGNKRVIADGSHTVSSLEPDGKEHEDDEHVEDKKSKRVEDATRLSADLVSWAVGVAFGRFDLHLATGDRAQPIESKPFDPLATCPLAMLTGSTGLALAQPPAGYLITFPEAGVLVDDLGHALDLLSAVKLIFEVVFTDDADCWLRDVSSLLDPKGQEIRDWLTNSFFLYHLKCYSKSRRKAPIFWQLSTPSGRYSVWLYAHRLTRDSFFQLQNPSDGIVTQKLAHEERKLNNLIQTTGGSPSVKERKELAAQETFVEELRIMLDEIRCIAPLWNPDLDDGVVLTMAPLWRLVPQCKSWQKELRAKWNELCAGKYDWAHIAMYLWPERVVPKCAKDRSLAIAQGLEEVFWVENDNGKWEVRSTPLRSIEELVHERTSVAVKAALRNLLDGPSKESSRVPARSRSSR